MQQSGRVVEMAFLEIKDVRKAYGHNEVLKGVSIDVNRHEVICLIGASGSGKSTLLRCVNQLEQVNGGEILIEGDTVTGAGVDLNRLRRDVGIVFQSYNLFPHMSVLKNVMLAPTMVGGVDSKTARDKAMTLLDSVGMAEKANAYPDMLSVVSSSASRSCARSRWNHASCCWTRSPRRSTPSWSVTCWRSCGSWPTTG